MAKNYMADVAKMLGVELGEEFNVTNDDYVYRSIGKMFLTSML